ncbi:hypothetical protein BC936DRAFT_137268 [Jimgerdemannia flammicorona]|uniref:Uncharacterized protein n=1 Tax=Jimgerdemannia flammicorona TaxID=994334 RepID=A0A433CXR1_9FUNG|nr:hypothetical protein BC936DRAFT_137268 [Jimgerdemannia flammicorona]
MLLGSKMPRVCGAAGLRRRPFKPELGQTEGKRGIDRAKFFGLSFFETGIHYNGATILGFCGNTAAIGKAAVSAIINYKRFITTRAMMQSSGNWIKVGGTRS